MVESEIMLNDVTYNDLSNLAINMCAKPSAFALLLGSGISREADIPTSWGVTLDLVERLYKTSGEDSSAVSQDEPLAWYPKKFGKELDYSDLVENLGKPAAGERDLLDLCSITLLVQFSLRGILEHETAQTSVHRFRAESHSNRPCFCKFKKP